MGCGCTGTGSCGCAPPATATTVTFTPPSAPSIIAPATPGALTPAMPSLPTPAPTMFQQPTRSRAVLPRDVSALGPSRRFAAMQRTTSRVVVFAKSQLLVNVDPIVSEIYTDPVSLRGADRAAVHIVLYYAWGGSTGYSFTAFAEVSNDGVNWVGAGPAVNGAAPFFPFTAASVGNVNGAYLRFRYEYSVTGVGIGAICFDLHVLLDKK